MDKEFRLSVYKSTEYKCGVPTKQHTCMTFDTSFRSCLACEHTFSTASTINITHLSHFSLSINTRTHTIMATCGNGNCIILWSTQSGRAKACARRVTRLVTEQSTLSVQSQSTFDELGWASLQSTDTPLWVLLVSTTGDGEHCDSIKETWKQLCVC